jgi:hypothetical protein
MRRLATALALGLALAATVALGAAAIMEGEGEPADNGEAAESAALPPPEQSGAAYERRVIRGWLLALNRDDYDGAADFFAFGAIIDQGEPFRLRGRSDARIFNAGLPCRADLAGVEDEPGPRSLASFRLRSGPGGPCTGIVKVRFTIREGKFTEWRQLPEQPEPPGPVV